MRKTVKAAARCGPCRCSSPTTSRSATARSTRRAARSTRAAYEAWIDGFAAGIGNAQASSSSSPTASASSPSTATGASRRSPTRRGTPSPRRARIRRRATRSSTTRSTSSQRSAPNALVYLDGTHSAWLGVGDVRDRLANARRGARGRASSSTSRTTSSRAQPRAVRHLDLGAASRTPPRSRRATSGRARTSTGTAARCPRRSLRSTASGTAPRWTRTDVWSDASDHRRLNTSGSTCATRTCWARPRPPFTSSSTPAATARARSTCTPYAAAPYNQPAGVLGALTGGNWCNPPGAGLGPAPDGEHRRRAARRLPLGQDAGRVGRLVRHRRRRAGLGLHRLQPAGPSDRRRAEPLRPAVGHGRPGRRRLVPAAGARSSRRTPCRRCSEPLGSRRTRPSAALVAAAGGALHYSALPTPFRLDDRPQADGRSAARHRRADRGRRSAATRRRCCWASPAAARPSRWRRSSRRFSARRWSSRTTRRWRTSCTTEFKALFPDNAIHYFVSYYDYYQPEAYVPSTDTYIEKDSLINEEIDRMRHAATYALLTRRDVADRRLGLLHLRHRRRRGLPRHEAGPRARASRCGATPCCAGWSRSSTSATTSTSRAARSACAATPSRSSRPTSARRRSAIEWFGDEIETISEVDPLRGKVLRKVDEVSIFPGSHYVTPADRLTQAR